MEQTNFENVEKEIIVYFESDYELIKLEPNAIWGKYEDKINKVVCSLGYWKNFDSKELIQQSYIFFVELCEDYDPYYNGNFIPFDKYIFKNLIIKLRAFIQRYYFKRKREQPTEFTDFNARFLVGTKNNIAELDEKMYSEYVYSLIPERQRKILDLSVNGYRQQEIGEILDISQSRVSVVKKKTLSKLLDILNEDGEQVKPKKKKNKNCQ